jgi:hypothetical protein
MWGAATSRFEVMEETKPRMRIIILALMVGFGLLNAQKLYAREAVLENYLLSHGGTPGARSDGIAARLSDEYFGNGTAKARVRLILASRQMRLDHFAIKLNAQPRLVGQREITINHP